MPNLQELASREARKQYSQRIAGDVQQLRSQSADVNGGIKTTEELLSLVHDGRKVSFDYERLVDEAASYE